MKPEAQRIAIAQACGWAYHNKNPLHGPQSIKSWYWMETNMSVSCVRELPDYLNDLNAMHEAEKVLTDKQTEAFAFELAKLTLQQSRAGWWDLNITELAAVIGVTAAQRAEAFLRTIGKWEDDK